MIRIMSPLNESCDVALLSQYVDEFYAGIADQEWYRATNDTVYYNTRGNSRGIANFHSWEAFGRSIACAGQAGRPVYLTVNSHNLDERNLNIARRIIHDFAGLGGSGVICSELNCLEYAKEEHLRAILSTNMALYNLKSIQYLLRQYEVDRVILSRDMTLREIRVLRENLDTELEVFGMNFGCRFSNGLCMGTHSHETGGLCGAVQLMKWDYQSAYGQSLDLDWRYQSELNGWNYANYFLNHACGLCALYELCGMGVDSFKIVGRELTGERILQCAKEVSEARTLADCSRSEQEFLNRVRARRQAGENYGCKWGYQCYYPEKYVSF